MLNIKFTLSGRGGFAYDICRKSPHSQSRVTAASATVLVLLATGILNDLGKLSLRQLRACVVGRNLTKGMFTKGLVSCLTSLSC